jgi:hypothetical protein
MSGFSGGYFTGVPASAAAPGTSGQLAFDGSFLYVCVSSNAWRRTALSTF